MKKLFLVLAMAGVMAACGGEEKKKEDVKSLAKQTVEAVMSNDMEALDALEKKVEALSEADQEAFKAEVEKLMQEAM